MFASTCALSFAVGKHLLRCSWTAERIARTDGLGRRCAVIAITSIVLQAGGLRSQAQVLVPDSVLPTQVGIDGDLGEFTVTGGQAQGGNLFHGFEAFSPGDWSVRFDLAPALSNNAIERIFARVTGSEPSFINGALSIVGGNSPDFFLLNPNGILFGPDAQLHLAGSFIGTTAEAIQFADGAIFPASLSSEEGLRSPLLSMSVPTGLQMNSGLGSTGLGRIEVQGPGHRRMAGDLSPIIASRQQPIEAKRWDSKNAGHELKIRPVSTPKIVVERDQIGLLK